MTALISVLRQLRAGHTERPKRFPSSVILCGVRDVRDYRPRTTESKELVTGGSAFNIKVESLRLGDFDRDEVESLLKQHTCATGQQFSSEAVDGIWYYTQGQPWLVNAIAYEICFKSPDGQGWKQTITGEMVDKAKEDLITARAIHLDQLSDKLREDRVRQIVGPHVGRW